jgi:threonine dehydrogenase-like Zn-dependent dehydrogenase
LRALVYGVAPEPADAPLDDNPLSAGLASTPMRLMEVDDPDFLRPDWVITAPRLTGICGSDAKQVFMDFGDVGTDNPMIHFTTFPQTLGHEVVADVVALGPEAEGLNIGDRVVLNPWLSCRPRGLTPVCAACAVGDLSLCENFLEPPIAAGIHIGTSRDASGGYAELMPAHPSMLFRVPPSVSDEVAVFADPFAVSLHAVTRHPPPDGGRVLVYGAGSLGTAAVMILRELFPTVEVGVVARFRQQAEYVASLGATVFAHEPVEALIEAAAAWSGGVLRGVGGDGLPMAYPGGIDVVYDTVSKKDSLEVSVRLLRARGTLVKAGVHGTTNWEWTPLYFKEISWVGSNAFGVEEIAGERKHGIEHFLDLAVAGRADLSATLTHRFPLEQWRPAFAALADQGATGAMKVAIDQREEHPSMAGV